MLELLHIENIAVIQEADIQFRPGFNALTGETGAGKSIVIDAMGAYWAGAPPETWSAPARTGPLSAPNFPRCPVIWPGWRRPELPRTRTATCCSSGS